MTPDETAALITSGESETLALRETTGTCREAAETVCAFLNQRARHGMAQAGVLVGHHVSDRAIKEPSTGYAPLGVLRK